MRQGIVDSHCVAKGIKPLEIKMTRKEAQEYLYNRACRRYGEKNLRPPKRKSNLWECFTYDEFSGIVMFWYNLLHDFTTRAEIAILNEFEG